MTGGVERFRHQRTRLEKLVVHIDDHDLTRVLNDAIHNPVLHNLEVRFVNGDFVFLGEVGEETLVPFLFRARMEIASVAGQRSVLLSVYETRIFGPADLAAPQLVARVLDGMGLGTGRAGPTATLLDPVTVVLDEVAAELGWKMPDHRQLKLTAVSCSAGQLRISCDLQPNLKLGPRVLDPSLEHSARVRRFLADYDARASTQYGGID